MYAIIEKASDSRLRLGVDLEYNQPHDYGVDALYAIPSDSGLVIWSDQLDPIVNLIQTGRAYIGGLHFMILNFAGPDAYEIIRLDDDPVLVR